MSGPCAGDERSRCACRCVRSEARSHPIDRSKPPGVIEAVDWPCVPEDRDRQVGQRWPGESHGNPRARTAHQRKDEEMKGREGGTGR
nr:hypothetical protein CFP56_33544 [Quercus suber]